MKKLKLVFLSLSLLLTIVSVGQTTLNFRFANPRVIYYTNATPGITTSGDYFEFDVQVKAQGPAQYFYSSQVALSFNSLSLSGSASNWIITKGAVLSGTDSDGAEKYDFDIKRIVSGVLLVTFNGNLTSTSRDPFSSTDWNSISSSNFETLLSVKVLRSGSVNETAGIDFAEDQMDAEPQYIMSGPVIQAYTSPNVYDPANFTDTYLGRIYANSTWTQTGGSTNGVAYTNWNEAVNTSVWDGDVTLAGGTEQKATNLRIHSGATLTIPATGQLTVTGNTDINTASGLTIQSADATHTGSLITASTSGSGSANVQRYMAEKSWRIATSPVSGQTIKGFLGANATIATNNTNTDLRGMTDYVMESNTWSTAFDQNSVSGDILVGKGYMLRAKTTDGAGPVNFTGTLNAAATSVSLLTTGTGWNCVGNPFTSAILTDDLINDNITGVFATGYEALYVYNGTSYDIVNLGDGANNMQAGQGFFVKAASATNLKFGTELKVHDNGAVLKSGNVDSKIKLIVSSDNKSASTLIKFIAGTSKGLDKGYDAGIFKSTQGLDLYTRLVEDNGIDFGLQCMSDNDVNSSIIPVGLDSKTGGEVVFSAELMNLPTDCKVILEDKVSKTFTDLSVGDYTTSVEANSSIADRFQLHTSYQTTGIGASDLASNLSAYAVRNTEIRVKGQVSKQAVATLYDVQGRVVVVKNLEEGSLNTIATPNIKTGIYMLYVKENGRVQGFKIPVKE